MKKICIIYLSLIFIMLACDNNVVESAIENGTISTLVLDNFEKNTLLKDSTLGNVDYTNQNYLGLQFGGYLSLNPDSFDFGGGHWYPIASSNGARILTVNKNGDTIVILDSVETGATAEDATDEDMKQLFGDDSMTVILDCRGVKGSYWAAIGGSIAGFPPHLYKNGTLVEGVSHIIDAKDPEGNIVQAACWNLENLVSITIEGKLQGEIFFQMTGVKENKKIGSVQKELIGGSTSLIDITTTFETSSFTPANWGGEEWDEIKKQVSSIALELDTDVNDYASIKLNAINLNFSSRSALRLTFPFLYK